MRSYPHGKFFAAPETGPYESSVRALTIAEAGAGHPTLSAFNRLWTSRLPVHISTDYRPVFSMWKAKMD